MVLSRTDGNNVLFREGILASEQLGKTRAARLHRVFNLKLRQVLHHISGTTLELPVRIFDRTIVSRY
jgi:hypothetical protein